MVGLPCHWLLACLGSLSVLFCTDFITCPQAKYYINLHVPSVPMYMGKVNKIIVSCFALYDF